jgi:hypothetical protein
VKILRGTVARSHDEVLEGYVVPELIKLLNTAAMIDKMKIGRPNDMMMFSVRDTLIYACTKLVKEVGADEQDWEGEDECFTRHGMNTG